MAEGETGDAAHNVGAQPASCCALDAATTNYTECKERGFPLRMTPRRSRIPCMSARLPSASQRVVSRSARPIRFEECAVDGERRLLPKCRNPRALERNAGQPARITQLPRQ
jgi:hypothetical protein